MPVGVSDTVGAQLRSLRKRVGLSVEEVAKLCAGAAAPELTANVLYAIEGGRRKEGERTRTVTVDELFALARALEVTPGMLLPGLLRECATCRGTPPAGFTCRACGTEGGAE